MTYADLERRIEQSKPKMMNLILKLIGGPDKLITLIVQKVLGPLLTKSGSGWKTVAGIFVWLLGYAISQRPDLPVVPFLNALIDALQPYVGAIQDTGLLAILAGLGKKLVDFIPKKST